MTFDPHDRGRREVAYRSCGSKVIRELLRGRREEPGNEATWNKSIDMFTGRLCSKQDQDTYHSFGITTG